ncbi:MAG: FAD-dependent oxidoreductase [Chloroflexi bacterium]|nr:FAD-dependent oxidoreductase [Chloroflexota bacterium]
MARRYVIVGNSAGGVGAAEGIRQVDREGQITIVSDEPYPAYSRPMISKYLAGEADLAHMLYRPADFYAKQGIELLTGTAASALDLQAHTLTLADGRRLAWDQLLLATGGTPFVPRTEGLDREGVFTFTTLDDAKRLAAKLSAARRAVVIGGGLIGISVAEALAKKNLAVSVVELKDRILNMVLDEPASVIAEEAVRRAGVEVLCNTTVASVVGRPQNGGAVVSVFLDNGREVPCDLLVVAIGVVPRTDLAKAAGLKVNRGIVVDEHMATDAPGVYACGDCVEAYDFAADVVRPTPVWPNAYLGGRTAGRNMAGDAAVYPGGTACSSLNYFGLSLVSAGVLLPPANDGFQVLSRVEPERGLYRKLVLRGEQLAGLIYVGDINRAGIAFGLMREGAAVAGFAEELLADGFGLISLPRELRQSRLEGKFNGVHP